MKPIVYAFSEDGKRIVLPNEPPFDGESVLLKTPDGIVEGWWSSQGEGTYEDPHDCGGFCWVILDGIKELELDDATHWMPLPLVEEETSCESVFIEEESMSDLVEMMRSDPRVKGLSPFNSFASED